MIHIVMDIFEITFSMFDYLLYVIIIMLIYGIKIIQKMPIFLTGCAPSSITGGALFSSTDPSITSHTRR
jgi:Na+/glutamate symporter